jgi:hypothetical protein
MVDVGAVLERVGVASFGASFDDLVTALRATGETLSG